MPTDSLAALADDYVGRLRTALGSLSREELTQLGDILTRAYRNGKQVFTVGNGGSSSLASHMAADLAKNTIGPHMRRFRIMSLNENVMSEEVNACPSCHVTSCLSAYVVRIRPSGRISIVPDSKDGTWAASRPTGRRTSRSEVTRPWA